MLSLLLTVVFPGSCYSLQITKEETEAWGGKQLAQGHTVLEAPGLGLFLWWGSLLADMAELSGTEFHDG